MADYGLQNMAANATYDAKREHNPDAFYNIAEQANGRMGDFLMSLSALTDQLCGGEPPAMNSGGQAGLIKGVPNGHFANATEQCGQIMTKLEQANRLLQRIRDQL